MERNLEEKAIYSTNREFSSRFKRSDSRFCNSHTRNNSSTRNTSRDIVSPTYHNQKKSFISSLRNGNKSSSTLKLKTGKIDSIFLGSNDNEEKENKIYNNKLNVSKDKSIGILSTNADNGKINFYFYFIFCPFILHVLYSIYYSYF